MFISIHTFFIHYQDESLITIKLTSVLINQVGKNINFSLSLFIYYTLFEQG